MEQPPPAEDPAIVASKGEAPIPSAPPATESRRIERTEKNEAAAGDNGKAGSHPQKKNGRDGAPSNKAGTKATSSESGNGRDSKVEGAQSKPASKKGTGTRRKNENMVGSGASLLNRKARGAKGDQGE